MDINEFRHSIVVSDEEHNIIILGLDALIDEWVDRGQPAEGYSWIDYARRMRARLTP